MPLQSVAHELTQTAPSRGLLLSLFLSQRCQLLERLLPLFHLLPPLPDQLLPLLRIPGDFVQARVLIACLPG